LPEGDSNHMASQRFHNLPAERQEALLAAAADEFAAHGYAAASMNRIVERAGSSKGAFYYYFENKADLLATVVEAAMTRVLADMEFPEPQSLSAETFWDRLREAMLASMRLLDVETWYMRVLRAFYRLREEQQARAATAGVMDRGRDLASAFLHRGQDLGVVRTDLPLELLVHIYVAADEAGDRWMMQRWKDLSATEKHALMDARIDLARDMLDAKHMGWNR
jgi:AcrR family transcriptional regulator